MNVILCNSLKLLVVVSRPLSSDLNFSFFLQKNIKLEIHYGVDELDALDHANKIESETGKVYEQLRNRSQSRYYMANASAFKLKFYFSEMVKQISCLWLTVE